MKEWIRQNDVLVSLLVFTGFFLPVFLVGFIADDRIFVFKHITQPIEFWTALRDTVSSSYNNGRFVPLSTFLYTAMYSLFDYDNAWLYHVIVLSLTYLSILLFRKWNRLLGFETSLTWLVVLFISLTQLRVSYNDAIVSYHGLLQVTSIVFFSSAIFLEKYLNETEPNIKYIVFFFVLLCIGLMTYELFYFLVPIYLYAIYRHIKQRHFAYLRLIVTICVVVGFYVALNMLIRQNSASQYIGTKFDFNMIGMLRAWILQIIGSLPLSYGAHLATRVGINSFFVWFSFAIFSAILCVLLFLPSGKHEPNKNHRNRPVLFAGLLLWTGSAFSIALSARYQNELMLGLAYLPVYLQVFGLIMILQTVVDNRKSVIRSGVALLAVMTFMMNTAILYEAAKIEGASRLTFALLRNEDVATIYHSDLVVHNEMVFYTDEQTASIVDRNFGNPLRIKFSDLDEFQNPDSERTVAIVLATNDRFPTTKAITGLLDTSTKSITNTVQWEILEREDVESLHKDDSGDLIYLGAPIGWVRGIYSNENDIGFNSIEENNEIR